MPSIVQRAYLQSEREFQAAWMEFKGTDADMETIRLRKDAYSIARAVLLADTRRRLIRAAYGNPRLYVPVQTFLSVIENTEGNAHLMDKYLVACAEM